MQPRYKNYSSYPLNSYTNDGVNRVIIPQELYTEVNPQIQDTQIFRNGDRFADDCRFGCGDMPSKLAASGRISGKDILNTAVSGLSFWSSSQQKKAEAEAAQKAAEIARLNLLAEQQKTKQKEQQAGIVKAYGVPLAIGGAVIIAGVAAYFIFKKKK